MKTKKKSVKKSSSSSSKAAITSAHEHKAALERLRENDPEFFKFLQEEDAELLDFDESDDELPEDGQEVIDGDELSDDDDEGEEEMDGDGDEEDSDEGDDESIGSDPAVDKVSKKFESSGEEEDEEEEDSDDGENVVSRGARSAVTMALVNEWNDALNADGCPLRTVEQVVGAFEAAVERAGAENVHSSVYVVHDAATFNAVVRLCFTALPPMFAQALHADDDEDKKEERHGGKRGDRAPAGIRYKHWGKYKRVVRKYLLLLTTFVTELQDADVTMASLRHVHALGNLVAAFPKICKRFLSLLVRHWSRGAPAVRVQAFVTIVKLVTRSPKFVSLALRQLYTAYVNNCRQITPTTWPMITFMQTSLAEYIVQQAAVSYEYVFVYIRQMAIHLRNANIARKTELVLAVYNWQYIQCLYLWCRVLAEVHRRLAGDLEEGRVHLESIDELRYPLIQVVLGTARLVNSPRYYPLRIHCLRAVTHLLQADDRLYVPVVPVVVDMLSSMFLQRAIKSRPTAAKSKGGAKRGGPTTTLKPVNMDCLLKVSKSAQNDPQFKHALIECIHEQLIRLCYARCCHLAFPEIAVLLVEQLRQFTRSCKVMAHTQPFKQLVQHISQQVHWLEGRRAAVPILLTSPECMIEWSSITSLVRDESPFGRFYTQWHKTHARQMAARKLNQEEEEDDDQTDESSDDEELEMEEKPTPPPRKKAKEMVTKPKEKKVHASMDLSSLNALHADKQDHVEDIQFSDDDD